VTGFDAESESADRVSSTRDFDAGRVAILTETDSAFTQRVLALDAVRQRNVAAWAARWACRFADVDTRPEVARALQCLDDEGRLPEPFNNAKFATAFRPLQPESGTLANFSRPAGSPRIPLAPWAAAFDATFNASNVNPTAAAVNALVGAYGGQADPTQLLNDAWQYIASMANEA
jgi:hypothetical protein